MQYANSSNGNGASVPVVALGLFTGGSVLAYATAGGAQNNLNPGGAWPANTIGRLEVDTTLGNENWTGLLSTGLIDGYGLLIKITAGNNVLTLNNQNAGSAAGNRFQASGDLNLVLGQQMILVYDTGKARWLAG